MPNQEKHYLKKLFAQELVSGFGYLAPLSMLALFLSEFKDITTSQVSLAMLLSSITARWGRLIFAPVLELLKPSVLLAVMQIVGALGYFLLTFYHSFSIMLLALIFIGFFYGSNTIFIRVLTSFLKEKTNQSTINYSIIHIATNIAATLGPILVNFIYIYYNKEFAFISICIFLCLSSIYTLFSLKNISFQKQNNYFKNIFLLLRSKNLFHFYFLIVLSWFFCAQIYTLAPIIISQTLKLPQYIWTIPTLNGVMIIILSVHLNKFFHKFTKNYYYQISLSLIFSLLGFYSIIMNYNIINLYFGVVLLTLSETLFVPAFQALCAELVPEDSRVAIFAIYAVFMGMGEGMGYYFGSKSLNLLNSNLNLYKNSSYILLILILVGIFISIQKTFSIKKNI
ncbi:MFS transporter [Silvanigrella aquatica]|uniref:Major facilitator superfamily (MFS) profile domain-containing protein n=1 Tax=Silvanigrella aquatica TaxID=1915309 RepID=A0A1L4CX78_9BACT|nr:MFS transporter [Silvanigrella aquatica]APJ02546.1 hypothetical protein AXG55_00795 [Silvanigrella aquatica]